MYDQLEWFFKKTGALSLFFPLFFICEAALRFCIKSYEVKETVLPSLYSAVGLLECQVSARDDKI